MPFANSAVRYGPVARALHWATAALVALAFGLGLAAAVLREGATTPERIAAVTAHKTAGLAALALILVRLAWAAGQPRPVPLHPGRRRQVRAAAAVHAVLYVGLAAVPLTGFAMHIATPGSAPLPWPLDRPAAWAGGGADLAAAAGTLHRAFVWTLAAAVTLHVAAALHHALADRDATLARMWRGVAAGTPGAPAPRLPLAAAAAFLVALGATALALRPPGPPAAVAASGDWRIAAARLTFTIRQMGAQVEGRLPAFDARIRFDPARREGTAGEVLVVIDMDRLSLGAWTEEARSAAFLAVERHPQAVFAAEIRPEGAAWLAEGTLTLRGVTVPVSLPFTLRPDGAGMAMAGAVRLDRHDFGITAEDEATLGRMVDVAVTLTALPSDAPP